MVHKHFKEYRGHTAVKHAILKDYVGAWAGILGSWNRKIIFIDGFCGPGYYEDDGETHDGSPIIALRVAEHFVDKFDMYCLFIDNDQEHCDELECRISELGFKAKYDVVCSTFEETVSDILGRVDRLAPAFCFIDPFGYSGLPLELIKDFLGRPGTETFINFMYEPISRFIAVESQHPHMDELFGTDEWREVIRKDLRKEDRESFLRDLYRNQLSNCAKYVWPFQLKNPDKDFTYYYLFHCTNHHKGIIEMKKVMYQTGTVGTYSYQGKESLQRSLFSTEPITDELEDYLLKEFSGKEMAYEKIVVATLDSPFIDKHYKEVLNKLRQGGIIQKRPVTTKGLRGFSGDDVAVFPVKKKGKKKIKGFF